MPRVLRVLHHEGFVPLSDGGAINDLSLVEADTKALAEGMEAPVCLPSVAVRLHFALR